MLQDRLVGELRLDQATDLDSANAVHVRFIADYNRRFARPPRESTTAWRPAPPDLDRICCFVHPRVVSNDNVVQWQAVAFRSLPKAAASELLAQKSTSTILSMAHHQVLRQHQTATYLAPPG